MAQLAQTPPMGYNTWNTFGPDINEATVLETVDAFVEKGFREAGYEYIVIDDCWSLRERDAEGHLVADPEKFPHGMKYIADYVHERGLKFGMYSCAGVRTCAGYPSSFDYEYEDAATFASFGVDFLKYDYCNFPAYANCRHRYLTMAQALRSCGRDILFSACNWGEEKSWEWMRSIGAHMYRSTGDIFDTFDITSYIMKNQMDHFNANAAGCFNDMDMLTVGMDGKGNVAREAHQTYTEYETHFAYWCFCGAPLMLGADLRTMDDRYLPLLQNPRLIALDQDPACRPAMSVGGSNPAQDNPIFMRHLDNNDFAICVVNFADSDRNICVNFASMGVPSAAPFRLELTDVITGESLGLRKNDIFCLVKSHGIRVFRAHLVHE